MCRVIGRGKRVVSIACCHSEVSGSSHVAVPTSKMLQKIKLNKN